VEIIEVKKQTTKTFGKICTSLYTSNGSLGMMDRENVEMSGEKRLTMWNNISGITRWI
jgi:hypothetical protein